MKILPKMAAILGVAAAVLVGAASGSVSAETLHGYRMQAMTYGDSVSGTTQEYEFGYSDELFASNEQSGTLAKASMALAAQAYGNGSQIKGLAEELGFTVLRQVNYDRVASKEDCDFSAFTIASKTVTYGEDEYTLYGVFIRGTAGNAEWYSNFNIGQEGDHYGFTASTEEVYAVLAETVAPEANNKIWITGHSRGAAVSNLLAAKLNEDHTLVRPENLVAYTFACPATTLSPVAYENIFNYNISGDIITAMPLASWGFGIHGVTAQLTLNDEANALYQSRTGNAYVGAASTDEFVAAMNAWCPVRADYDVTFTVPFVNFTSSPHLLLDEIVPILAGEPYDATQLLGQIITNPKAYQTILYFVNHQTEINQAHSIAAYISYLDALYPHEHVFEYVSNEDATCTEDGTLTGTCYCGETVTIVDEGSALGHDYVFVSNEDATCTEDGTLTGTCTRCGDTITIVDEGSALGHDFHKSVSEDGIISYTCERCGLIIRWKDISYAEVSAVPDFEYWGEPVYPEIEVRFMDERLQEGVDYTLNYVDNNAVGRAQIIIVAVVGENKEYSGSKYINFNIVEHVHTFGEYVSDGNATCTEDGTKTAHCTNERCDAVDTVIDEGSALGHNYVESVDEKGQIVFVCSNCGDTVVGRNLEYAVIAPIPDQEYHGEEIRPSVSITFLGEKLLEGRDYYLDYKQNNQVGDTAYIIVIGKGDYTGTVLVTFNIIEHKHVFGEYVSDGNATCTEDGTKTAHCLGEDCDETDTIPDVGSALGHDYVSQGVEFGIETFVCSRCGDSYKIRRIDAAEVSVDGSVIADGKSASEALTLTFMGTKLVEGSDYVLSSSYKIENEEVYLQLKIDGVGNYSGTFLYNYPVIEKEPENPVEPVVPVDPVTPVDPVDPEPEPEPFVIDWLVVGVSAGVFVIAVVAIVLAVRIGIKKRRDE